MPKNNLKRMNRFELLELMYKIVKENEQLTRRCAELERQLGYQARDGDYRSARESPRGYYEEPRTVSRRDEILARMDEQSSVPRTRREAVDWRRDDVLRRKVDSVMEATTGQPLAPAARRASQPAEEEHAPSRVRQNASSAARSQRSAVPLETESLTSRAKHTSASEATARPRPAPQAQSAAPRATVKQPEAKVPPVDEFDIDSILEDYFSDLPFDGKGRDA